VALSMMGSLNQFKVKSLKEWFKSDVPSDAIDLVTRMLQFNPSKRPTVDKILRHPYLAQFHNPREEYDSPKIIYPPVSDNKKLNMKQYRQLIYDRIKKIYRNGEEEAPVPVQRAASR
jgi:mitogen-activated protein kinase 15